MPTIAATVVGGTLLSSALNKPDKSGQKAQTSANERAQKFIEEQAAIAQRSSQRLFDSSQANLLKGNQGALDIYGQALPQQFSAFQQGNYGAQQQLAAGLPQMQNALLGLPVNYSQMQPRNINVDLGFLQQQLPQFQNAQQALALDPFEIMALQQTQAKLKQEQLIASQKASQPSSTQFRTGGGQSDRGRSSSRGDSGMGNAADGRSDRSGYA